MEINFLKINNKLTYYKVFKSVSPGLITLIFLCINFYIYDLFPFGRNTLAWGDMKQQVIPILLQFKNIIESNDSVLFYLGNSGGISLIGILFFFISSPFSFFVKIINSENLLLYVNIFVAIKIALSSISAYVMFSKINLNLKYFPILLLSLVYAFSGFNLMFYQNLVWLDLSYLFPILVLGLYKIIKYNKPTVYIASLTLIIITNYYMSYMVFLFLIITAGIFFYKNPKSCSIFCFSTILTILLSGIITVPSFFQFLESARSINTFNNLKSSLIFTNITSFSTVMVSSILLLLIYFLFNKNLYGNPPKKLFLIFIALLIPIFIEPINKMWHTGSYQAFPARFSYITLMLGLILLGYYFSKSKIFSDTSKFSYSLSKCMYLLFSFSFTVFVIIYSIYLTSTKKHLLNSYTETLWTDFLSFKLLFPIFLIFGIYLIILFYFKSLKLISLNFFKFFVTLILITEIFFNCVIYLGYSSNSIDNYKDVYDLQNKVSTPNLSRMKLQDKYFDVNLTGGLGYNSMATYTSLTSKNYLKTAKLLGFSSYWMEISSSQGTLFSDSIMANRFILQKNNHPNPIPLSDIIYKNSTFTILENNDVLDLGIPIKKGNLDDLYLSENENRFTNQNRIFNAITNANTDLFEFYSPDKEIISNFDDTYYETIIYNIDIDEKEVLYFDYFDKVSNNLIEPINNTFDVRVNGMSIINDYPKKNVNGILYLGTFENESVQVVLYANKDKNVSSFGVAGMDYNLFTNYIQSIKNNNYVDSVNVNGNKITLDISKSNFDNEYLLLSIPYNGNITAKSKDDSLIIEKVLDSFIALELPSNHSGNITITFVPKGTYLGLFITFLGIIISISILILKKQKIEIKNKLVTTKIHNICSSTFNSIFIICIILIYIFPIIIMFFD